MMRKLFIFILLFLRQLPAESQYIRTWGIGASAGVSNYNGDLDGNFTLQFSRFGFGLHLIKPVSNYLDFRINYFHGQLYADDAHALSKGNQLRNLMFKSPIQEIGFNVILKYPGRARRQTDPIVVPYIFGGIAYFQFKPQALLNGQWYDLQPLGTEGQFLPGSSYPVPYKLNQFSIPVGAGMEFNLTDNLVAGLEIGFRKTFTDYLDDVSDLYPDLDLLLELQGPIAYQLSNRSDIKNKSYEPRGNPERKDWYIYTNVNLTYYFTKSAKSSGKGNKRKKHKSSSCPAYD
jgi:hypothetical protein